MKNLHFAAAEYFSANQLRKRMELSRDKPRLDIMWNRKLALEWPSRLSMFRYLAMPVFDRMCFLGRVRTVIGWSCHVTTSRGNPVSKKSVLASMAMLSAPVIVFASNGVEIIANGAHPSMSCHVTTECAFDLHRTPTRIGCWLTLDGNASRMHEIGRGYSATNGLAGRPASRRRGRLQDLREVVGRLAYLTHQNTVSNDMSPLVVAATPRLTWGGKGGLSGYCDRISEDRGVSTKIVPLPAE